MSDRQETDREIKISGLMEQLENILSRLDTNGHAIAAIRVEEAIFALKHDLQQEASRHAAPPTNIL